MLIRWFVIVTRCPATTGVFSAFQVLEKNIFHRSYLSTANFKFSENVNNFRFIFQKNLDCRRQSALNKFYHFNSILQQIYHLLPIFEEYNFLLIPRINEVA